MRRRAENTRARRSAARSIATSRSTSRRCDPFAGRNEMTRLTVAAIAAVLCAGSIGLDAVVEDVTGAAGSIGVGRVAHAPPDGYTISLGHWSTHVVNGAIYNLSYDLL